MADNVLENNLFMGYFPDCFIRFWRTYTEYFEFYPQIGITVLFLVGKYNKIKTLCTIEVNIPNAYLNIPTAESFTVQVFFNDMFLGQIII